MTIPLGVRLEREHALMDVQYHVNEYGADNVIQYIRGSEAKVDRDKYTSIKYRDITATSPEIISYTMKAFPVEYMPSREQVEKAGLREICECVIYTSMKDWTTAGLVFEDIDMIRDTIVLNGIVYMIKEKSQQSQFADTFLYITFGLARR